MSVESLTAIAERFGTDKAGLHAYTDFYDDLLARFRERPVKLLEVGIGGNEDESVGGHSLRMWKEYFPLGQITGLDLYDKRRFAEERIDIVVGDQSDAQLLRSINADHGPFDVIVDDGSHISAHVIKTFTTLFPLLRPGGVYIIEDLQTSYWPSWGGSLLRRSRWTSMGFLKDRVDGLNFRDFRTANYRPSEFDRTIEEIRFRHNTAAILKSSRSDDEDYASVGWKGMIEKSLTTQLRNAARRGRQ